MARVYTPQRMRTSPAAALTAVWTPTVRKHRGMTTMPQRSSRSAPLRGTGPSNHLLARPRQPLAPAADEAPLAARRPSQ